MDFWRPRLPPEAIASSKGESENHQIFEASTHSGAVTEKSTLTEKLWTEITQSQKHQWLEINYYFRKLMKTKKESVQRVNTSWPYCMIYSVIQWTCLNWNKLFHKVIERILIIVLFRQKKTPKSCDLKNCFKSFSFPFSLFTNLLLWIRWYILWKFTDSSVVKSKPGLLTVLLFPFCSNRWSWEKMAIGMFHLGCLNMSVNFTE